MIHRRSGVATTPKQVLLIISCSAAKRKSPCAPLPAIERYDGVFFRVLHKAVREGYSWPKMKLVILSAKYGLIRDTTPIPYYDQRMNRERAQALRSSVRASLQQILRTGRFDRIYINLGREYATIIQELPALAQARWASGGIGQRAAILKSWLHDLSQQAKAPQSTQRQRK